MKIKRLLLTLLVVFVLLVFAACGEADVTELNRKIEDLESELNKKQSELAAKEAELKSKYDNAAFGDNGKISYGDLFDDEYYVDGAEGAASVEREGDVENTPYYIVKDYYNLKSSETLTILEKFKTIQQGTEWTCGPTSALMALEWFNKRGDLNELDLARLRRDPDEGKKFTGATNLREMIRIFEALNAEADGYTWTIESTYDFADGITLETKGESTLTMRDKLNNSPNLAEEMIITYLEQGIPVIIGTDEWGGHWQVVIGYDNMGTDTTADDVLILADPYDTTDHCQDGYVVQSFERLYYNWKNTFDPLFGRNVFLAVYPEAN